MYVVSGYTYIMTLDWKEEVEWNKQTVLEFGLVVSPRSHETTVNEDIDRTVPLIKAGCDTSPSHHITTTLIGGTVEFAPLKYLEEEGRTTGTQRIIVVRWCWPVSTQRMKRARNSRGGSIVSRRFSSTFFRRPHLHESEGHCAMIKRIRKRWITLSSFNDRETLLCTQRCFSVLLYISLCQVFICRDTWKHMYMYRAL